MFDLINELDGLDEIHINSILNNNEININSILNNNEINIPFVCYQLPHNGGQSSMILS